MYKLGKGPLYLFYRPYHLCHFETPLSVARAVLFNDATLAPLNGPKVEVVAAAKTDLKKGDKLDGLGHYMTYGVCENYHEARSANLLPIGLAEDCTLTRDLAKDELITFDDVVLPRNRLCDKLWAEQLKLFPVEMVIK